MKYRRVFECLALPGLLANMIQRRSRHHADYDDMVQDGYVGLLTASRRYKPKYRASFKTYASRRVHGAIIDGMAAVGWPRYISRFRRRLGMAMQSLQKGPIEPSFDELAEYFGWDQDRLVYHANRLRELENLQTGEGRIPDILRPPVIAQPDAILYGTELRAIVKRELLAMDPQQRRAVMLTCLRGLSILEASKQMGMCATTAGKLKAAGVARLREAMKGVL